MFNIGPNSASFGQFRPESDPIRPGFVGPPPEQQAPAPPRSARMPPPPPPPTSRPEQFADSPLPPLRRLQRLAPGKPERHRSSTSIALPWWAMSPEFCPTFAKLGPASTAPNRPDLGDVRRSWAGSGQIVGARERCRTSLCCLWPTSDRNRSALGKVGRTRTKSGLVVLSDFRRTWLDIDRTLSTSSKFGLHHAGVRPTWNEFAKLAPGSGGLQRVLSSSDRPRPNLVGRLRPSLGPNSAKLGDFGGTSPKSDRIWTGR